MNKKILNILGVLPVIFILILAIIFRFYKLQDWISWGMDQENEIFIVRNIVSGHHFPLIGLSIADTGMYRGPLLLYLSSIPYILFSGDPIGGALFASMMGVLVCFLIFYIGSKIFSYKVGFFASLLYSVSFLASYYDRRFWHPSFIPIISLLIGYLLVQVMRGDYRKLIHISFLVGLATHAHITILIFFPLILYVIIIHRKSISQKLQIYAMIGFILIQLPILFFDLRHNFLNTQAFIKLISVYNQTVNPSNITQRGALFLHSVGGFITLGPKPDLFLMSDQCQGFNYLENSRLFLGGLIIVIFLGTIIRQFILNIQKNKRIIFPKVQYQFLIGIYALILLFILFYSRQVFEYYLLFFFPWLAITLGWVIDYYWRQRFGKIITSFILIIIIFLNLYSLFTATYVYSYKDKIEAVAYAKQFIMGKKYSLEAIGDCPRYGGYRYLFDHYIHAPVNSYMDSYFAWLYPDTLEKSKVNYIMLLYLPDPRDTQDKIRSFEEQKEKWLSENKTVAYKKIGLTQIYILVPNSI